MQLSRNSSIEDFFKHFMSVCENSNGTDANMDSMFGDFDSYRKCKESDQAFESLEFMMLLKASEQKIMARYEFMQKQISKYASIITIIEASLNRVGVSSKFREMAESDLAHTKEMAQFHRKIFEYTVRSQSNQIVLHFAKEQGDQQKVMTLTNQIMKLVESIESIQNEIEKRSMASKQKLMQNINGLGKKNFFQARFS